MAVQPGLRLNWSVVINHEDRFSHDVAHMFLQILSHGNYSIYRSTIFALFSAVRLVFFRIALKMLGKIASRLAHSDNKSGLLPRTIMAVSTFFLRSRPMQF